MASMSNYLEGQIIDHIFRTNSYTKPTTLAIALCVSAPTDASTGATIPEVANSGSYARQTLNPLDANWSAPVAGDGTTKNSSPIVFPAATGVWGTITHVAIVDSATYGAGNMLFWGAIATPKAVSDGDVIQFAIDTFAVQLDS